jgi:hypothetical protein
MSKRADVLMAWGNMVGLSDMQVAESLDLLGQSLRGARFQFMC